MSSGLTQDEALLRVAFLMANADGRQSGAELTAISNSLGKRLVHLDGAQVESLALEALREVSQYPLGEVLPRLRQALPDRAARITALHVACQVARADGRLALAETEQLVELVAALELGEADVQKVLHTYWGTA